MSDQLHADNTHHEYAIAMRHVGRALRHGKMDEVKAWTAIAERLLNMETRHERLRISRDKRVLTILEDQHRRKQIAAYARARG